MSCSYIKKQPRRNSLQLQSFDAIDYDGNTKVIKLFLSYSIILWVQCTNSVLSFNFSFFDTADRGGRNNSENYHLRGTEPFHRRDIFNSNTLFLPYVSNVSE